jgi:hypothetical protein
MQHMPPLRPKMAEPAACIPKHPAYRAIQPMIPRCPTGQGVIGRMLI